MSTKQFEQLLFFEGKKQKIRLETERETRRQREMERNVRLS